MNKTHLRRTRSRAALVAALTVGTAAVCSAQIENNGVTAVPTSPPPTSPQMTVPRPMAKPGDPYRPLAKSPTLAQIDPRLAAAPISLKQAIAIALATNPNLAQAGENLLRAEGHVGVVSSQLNPSLAFTPGDDYIQRSFQLAYGIAATVPIDISHVLGTATEQAQFQEVGARLDVNRFRNEIVYNVETAFYGLLRSQALVKVAVTDLQNSLDRLRDAEVRYKAEAVAYIDVLRAQTDVANAQKGVIQARNAVSNSIASLNNAMGIDVTTPLQVTDAGAVEEPPGVAPPSFRPVEPNTQSANPTNLVPAPPPSSIHPEQVPQSAASSDAVIEQAMALGPAFKTVLNEALQTRPEIWEAEVTITAARKGVYVAQASALPSFSIGLGYFDERSTTGTRYNEPQAFVGFTIPIFDQGLARARVKEAKADVSSAVTAKRQEVDAVTMDVQQAYLALVQAQEQVAVANQALSQAQAAFDLAMIRYNTGVASHAGLSPQLEVSDAQVALTLASQNQVNALYDYNNARAQLDRSVGRFAYVGSGPGYSAAPSSKTVGEK